MEYLAYLFSAIDNRFKFCIFVGDYIPDTPENRKLLIDIAHDLSTRQGIDKHGNAWHSKIRDDGSQVWVQVRENKIRNGGINNLSKIWDLQTGYSAPNKSTKEPKNK